MVREPVPSPLTKSPPCIMKSLIFNALVSPRNISLEDNVLYTQLYEICYSYILVAVLGDFCFLLCRTGENFLLFVALYW